MIIVDPVALGDSLVTRATAASYYDRNGALQSAPANTLRATYNPDDLTAAPYALLNEGEVIGVNAGLAYSNVPETVPLWAPGSYAKGVLARDVNTVYESLADANTAALSDKTKWLNKGATNRRAMFDDRNNTQTSNPEEILVVLSARAITQGLYLGNLDASEVRISMTDQTFGVVFQQTHSLVVSSSASSFFRSIFNRIRRKSYFLTLDLPVFANALVTVAIRKPGGIPKCGMCLIGPVIDVGLSHYGLSTEIKDFSSSTFNQDGTSTTVVRGYAKRMSVDVEVDNDQVDSIEEQLIGFRQKVVVYVGAVMYGSAMLCGKFSSFKKVIGNKLKSQMALQIEGVVS